MSFVYLYYEFGISNKFNVSKEISGELRVQLPPMLSMHHISPKLPIFLKNNPKINLAVFYSKDFEVDRTYALTEIYNYAYAIAAMLLCLINSAIILLNNCRCT